MIHGRRVLGYVCIILFVMLTPSFAFSGEFLVIADVHLDLGYNYTWGESTHCRPLREDGKCFRKDVFEDSSISDSLERNYSVGRYGCDCSALLFHSLFVYFSFFFFLSFLISIFF